MAVKCPLHVTLNRFEHRDHNSLPTASLNSTFDRQFNSAYMKVQFRAFRCHFRVAHHQGQSLQLQNVEKSTILFI